MSPLQLVNICSNDGQRLYEAVSVGALLAGGPLVAVLGLSYTAYFLGPTALVGSTVFILFYPAMVRPQPTSQHKNLVILKFESRGGIVAKTRAEQIQYGHKLDGINNNTHAQRQMACWTSS